MRGEDDGDRAALYAYFRITPACAGKTTVLPVSAMLNEDHPRMRGEDLAIKQGEGIDPGSPPHARGRRRLPHPGIAGNGITPACAGKTYNRHRRMSMIGDHPRMRGEDAAYDSKSSKACGSPPHARGRLQSTPWQNPNTRITPACAGKTAQRTLAKLHLKDHPRMRGEDSVAKSARLCIWGSPPHARGRPARRRTRAFANWITPACAGKTETMASMTNGAKDHPRMRGEDCPLWHSPHVTHGSPPHARGRPKHVYDQYVRDRITPACAGKTQGFPQVGTTI